MEDNRTWRLNITLAFIPKIPEILMNIQQAGSQKIFEPQGQTNVVSVGRG
jgi:hypothetical protein